MSSTPSAPTDFKALVAAQFASRPTLWEQRMLGHQAVVCAAKRNEVLRVYRGQLRKGDVEGIISFE